MDYCAGAGCVSVESWREGRWAFLSATVKVTTTAAATRARPFGVKCRCGRGIDGARGGILNLSTPNEMRTKIAGKATADAEFRARLLSDPKAAIGAEPGPAFLRG